MQNSKRESTGNGTAPLTGGAPSPTFVDAAGHLTRNCAASAPGKSMRSTPPAENPAYKQAPPIRKPGQAPHRAAGTFPGVTTTYEPGYEKPSASPRESYWTC